MRYARLLVDVLFAVEVGVFLMKHTLVIQAASRVVVSLDAPAAARREAAVRARPGNAKGDPGE